MLETRLTKPFLGKYISLYHGSNKKLDSIKPNSINIGTKLSRFRLSSFWCADKTIPILFAIHQVLTECKQDLGVGFDDFSIDVERRKLLISNSLYNEIIHILEKSRIYIYRTRVSTEIIGRGNDPRLNEFSIDIEIKPETVTEMCYSTYKDYIEFVDDEILRNIHNCYIDGRIDIKRNSNIVEKAIYYSFREYKKKLKHFRSMYPKI